MLLSLSVELHRKLYAIHLLDISEATPGPRFFPLCKDTQQLIQRIRERKRGTLHKERAFVCAGSNLGVSYENCHR
jgi:hypothetical protein